MLLAFFTCQPVLSRRSGWESYLRCHRLDGCLNTVPENPARLLRFCSAWARGCKVSRLGSLHWGESNAPLSVIGHHRPSFFSVCWSKSCLHLNLFVVRYIYHRKTWEKTKKSSLFRNTSPFLMIWNYTNCSREFAITIIIIIVIILFINAIVTSINELCWCLKSRISGETRSVKAKKRKRLCFFIILFYCILYDTRSSFFNILYIYIYSFFE